MKGPKINGEQYVLVVLRIHAWDANGRPSKCEIGYDDTEFDLRDDKVSRHFMTAFVKKDMIKAVTPQ